MLDPPVWGPGGGARIAREDTSAVGV